MARKKYISGKNLADFRTEIQKVNDDPQRLFSVRFPTENNFIIIPVFGRGSANQGFNGTIYQDSANKTIMEVDFGVGIWTQALIVLSICALLMLICMISNTDPETLTIVYIIIPIVCVISFLIVWSKYRTKKKYFDSFIARTNTVSVSDTD